MQRAIFDIFIRLKADEKIILIDTEQGIHDFTRQVKTLKTTLKAAKLPGQFSAYLFRQYEPEVILKSIVELVEKEKPKILVLDNLTELVLNPNDMVEAKKVIQFLKFLTAKYDLVIIALLHTSKTTFNSLGNLGSYADRGAQTTLKVSTDKDTQVTTLEPVLMRSDLYFNPISIQWNADEKMYEQTTHTSEKPQRSRKFILMELTAADHSNRLAVVFRESKEYIYNEFVEEIKKIYGVGTNISKQQIIPYLVGNNFVRSNKGLYYL